ncbi:MAG TPA: sorbosone dehydrogenase family protein, partial [Ramlibacter sp.]|nr:sorbosone dehydrogenase family protein [Ramlibacter sp.]
MDYRWMPLLVSAALAGCGETARLPPGADEGPHPTLPSPVKTLLPTVNVAPTQGWPQAAAPRALPGFKVTALERGLEHPRWIY